jgi:hypothetical protein
MKTNVERVLDYLWSVSPNGATNAEIRVATGILRHLYDFGTTSKTDIKVVGFQERKATTKHLIALLARNCIPTARSHPQQSSSRAGSTARQPVC